MADADRAAIGETFTVVHMAVPGGLRGPASCVFSRDYFGTLMSSFTS
jgi:hypothetical protein